MPSSKADPILPPSCHPILPLLAVERGPVTLSRVMLALQSAYTQWFNRRHGRVGHLFQGRYKAFLIEKDRYLLALIRYIHRNPVEAGLARRPQDYAWSSDRYFRRASYLSVFRFAGATAFFSYALGLWQNTIW